jgi:SAM-dependent methyltransferase
MDDPEADRETLRSALDQIAAVNRWLGARRALRLHLPWALPGHKRGWSVLDVGTGAGDLVALISEWAGGRNTPIRIVALDLSAAVVDEVRARTRSRPGIKAVQADGLRLPFPDGTFDLVHLSMTLHHMDGPDLVPLLIETARVARGRVLVGELERCVPNYLGALLLAATLWRRNPITRHDGPLSVRRAFTAHELRALGSAAGLQSVSVHRHPFYRLMLRGEA